MDGTNVNVLMLSPLPPPAGGIASWTVGCKNYCEERNISLHLVNTALIGSRSARINSERRMLDEIKRTFKIVCQMRRQIKRKKPDIVHINTSCSRFGLFRDTLCVKIASRCGVAVVLHCHCNVQDQLTGRTVKAFRYATKIAAAVVVLNERSYQYVNQFQPKKLYKLPNFIDESWTNSQVICRKNIQKALFVGHVQKEKGLREILTAAERMPEIIFTLVGPVKEEDIQGIDCPENLIFLGAVTHEEVKKNLATADVFLFPSYSEGFSIAVIEAMAMGLPIIASDVGANAEVLEEHGGIIVPVANSEQIVTALQKMKPTEVRQKMAVWNAEKATHMYLRDNVMNTLFTYYAEIMGA